MNAGFSPAEAYALLGLNPDADADAIARAYRRAARRLHPDVNPDADTAADLAAVNEAYSLLTRPGDAPVPPPQTPRAGVQAAVPTRERTPAGEPPAYDVTLRAVHADGTLEADVHLTAEQLRQETPCVLRCTYTQPCPVCRGTGGDLGGPVHECVTCSGLGMSLNDGAPCPSCAGTGAAPSTPCPQCAGTARALGHHEATFTLPAGHDPARRYRVLRRGLGSPRPGDIYLTVHPLS